MYRFTIVLSLIFLVSLASLALADIPKLINYQGMLTNGSGEPLTGTYDITFKIYNAFSGGAKRWEETQTDVAVTDGLFNVILGGATIGGIDLDFSEEYWLDITVGAEHMPERLRFTSVGYAYRAKIADSATVAVSAPTGGGWTDDGTVVRLASGTDSVGIGTTSPEEMLHVQDAVDAVIKIGATAANGEGAIIFEEQNVDAMALRYVATENELRIDDEIAEKTRMVIERSGKVGIGTESPTQTLTVNGSIGIQKADTTRYHVSHYNQGLNFAETGVADYRIFIKDGGDVGIGTNNPGAKLGVNGDLKVTGAYRGNISSSSGSDGAPFPRPAYDSGWETIAAGETIELTHDIGGDIANYVVDLQFLHNSSVIGIHNMYYGGETFYIGTEKKFLGASYERLTSSSIRISRNGHDSHVEKVRVRIWVYE